MKKNIIAVMVLVLLTAIAYSNSFTGGFHFDDFHQIVGNQNITTLSEISRFFTSAETGSHVVGIKGYRPLTHLSFALNYALSGYDVFGYHLFNFLVHALNVILAFVFVSAILRRAGRDGFYPAFVTALLFAVHPIQTNSVTYISERAGLMAGTSVLAALIFLHLFRTTERRVYAGLSAAAFFLGLFAKENAVAFIGIGVAYDFFFTLPEVKKGNIPASSVAVSWITPLLILAGHMALRRAVMGHYVTAYFPYGTKVYLISEAKVLLMYLRMLLFPVNLNADYALPVTEHIDLAAAVSAIFVVSAFIFLIRARKTMPAAGFFGIWFFAAIAPESSLIPITDIAVEYRLYLPLAGFVAFFVIVADGCIKSLNLKKVAVAVVTIALISFSLHRNDVWATETSLWKDVAAKSPASTRAHVNLAAAYLRERKYIEAVDEFNATLRMDPDPYMRSMTYNNLATCYSNMGQPGEAVSPLLEAVRIRPDYKEAYTNLGAVYRELERYDESLSALAEAERIDPAYMLARYNKGKTLLMAGRPEEAMEEMELALRLAPRDFNVNYYLAVIYAENKMQGKAVEQAGVAAMLASDAAQQTDAQGLLSRLTENGAGERLMNRK